MSSVCGEPDPSGTGDAPVDAAEALESGSSLGSPEPGAPDAAALVGVGSPDSAPGVAGAGVTPGGSGVGRGVGRGVTPGGRGVGAGVGRGVAVGAAVGTGVGGGVGRGVGTGVGATVTTTVGPSRVGRVGPCGFAANIVSHVPAGIMVDVRHVPSDWVPETSAMGSGGPGIPTMSTLTETAGSSGSLT